MGVMVGDRAGHPDLQAERIDLKAERLN